MALDNLGVVFDIIMFLGCIYCAYSWYWMRTHGAIHKNPILISSKISIYDCKDKEGYLRYISPRLLIFSIIGICLGGINIYGNFRGLPEGLWLFTITMLLVDVIWFAYVISQSVKRFWDPEPDIHL